MADKDKLMTLTQLKKVVKGYDDLMAIKTKGLTRDELITVIQNMGYAIDHKKQTFRLTDKKKAMKRKPINVKAPIPKEKKTVDKKVKDKNERAKVIKYILANKDVLNDIEVAKLHNGVK
tara:strand:+ start:409 stop:765 length:357 start_codon:yes stop_codon:yes gene_type:complete